MKNKWLIFIALPLLLTGCKKKATISSSLEDDEKTLSLDTTELNTDSSAYFDFNFTYTTSDSGYLCHWTIGSSINTYTNARILITPVDDNGKYFFFGYDDNYTLMNKDGKSDSDNLVYKGFAINFSYTELATSFKVLFSSTELVRAFLDTVVV